MVQGAGGMQMTTPETLTTLIELTHKHGGLVIADEVMTGWPNRKTFCPPTSGSSTRHLLCRRGLTGGTLPLAATVFRDGLFEAFLDPRKERAFAPGTVLLPTQLHAPQHGQVSR